MIDGESPFWHDMANSDAMVAVTQFTKASSDGGGLRGLGLQPCCEADRRDLPRPTSAPCHSTGVELEGNTGGGGEGKSPQTKGAGAGSCGGFV